MSEPDINIVEIEYQKARVYESNAYEGQFADISKHLTFAKAAIILSESCVLEDINAYFNPAEIEEKQGERERSCKSPWPRSLRC
jgi:hypothetical protein